MGEEFPSVRTIAETLVRMRRQARSVRARMGVMPRDVRARIRNALKRAFDAESRLESGEGTIQEDRLALRELEAIERELAALMGDPGPLERLEPDSMIRFHAAIVPTMERFAPPRPMRLPWPLQYDLYKYERLAEPIYRFMRTFAEQERRTKACLEKLVENQKEIIPDHEPVQLDVMRHDGVLALYRPKRKMPPGF